MNILRRFKRFLYFPVAAYFSFWAAVYLRKWHPTIIVVTGSSGKTTLLHLFEAQLGKKAFYSHKANSAFGIPFNVLGLERKTFRISEWPAFFIRAPFQAFRDIRKEEIYVAEADAERPGEAPSIAWLLKPDSVIWLSLEEAHGINYDSLVRNAEAHADNRDALKKAMAHEFGAFIEYAGTARSFSSQNLPIILNKDNPYIAGQAFRAQPTIASTIKYVSEHFIPDFQVHASEVAIETISGTFRVPTLIPRNAALSVLAVSIVVEALGIEVDRSFSGFKLPPGRSSVFKGKKGATLIDSTYNATFDGMKAMLDLMGRYPAKGARWLVLGDMIEQGKSEKIEHQELAALIENIPSDRIVLVGPRLKKYTYPILVKKYGNNVVSYEMPAPALEYLQKELRGGETILFKGARFLEGLVEPLLADPADACHLCRREEVWVRRRKQWGLHS